MHVQVTAVNLAAQNIFMPESVCMNDNCFLDFSSDALHKQREGERGWVVRKYTETMQGLLVRVVSHFAGICC